MNDLAVTEEAHLADLWEPVPLGPTGREALGPSVPGERPGERDSVYGLPDEPPWR